LDEEKRANSASNILPDEFFAFPSLKVRNRVPLLAIQQHNFAR